MAARNSKLLYSSGQAAAVWRAGRWIIRQRTRDRFAAGMAEHLFGTPARREASESGGWTGERPASTYDGSDIGASPGKARRDSGQRKLKQVGVGEQRSRARVSWRADAPFARA